ncbi:hypothetical protein A3C94_00095 [Candidatus Kaiserbacteria bacterium RIFCSPHIGHO2_02_FULL_55_17]|uniref:Uncharacterized protein n=1 Tax=Candidatus Kaiserbacteria bacterium RIFCSPHIGHO2_02_FULL_55_17 TaxID=1798496 RepID=A0A1F6DV40_9BACT|nr:MAG: hypothetical protein A3C94_00095 [Candidatus Kaiserbacteria bacterium RIFCSPHIGHO2_02_FULL_55_17]
MKTLKIRCVGISPLMMDPMSEAQLKAIITKVPLQVARDRPFEDVAAEKIYREPGGRVALNAGMLFSCLVKAGRNIKIGKKAVSTAETTTLPDFLSIVDEYMPLTNIPANANGHEKEFWAVDIRKGTAYNGPKPTACGIVRPKFPKWEFEVTVRVDEKKVDDSTVTALFTNAGSTQGLGSFRPNKKGTFGRFEVAEMKEVKATAH